MHSASPMRLTICLLPLLAACASAPPPADSEAIERADVVCERVEPATPGGGDYFVVGLPADLPGGYLPSLRSALARETAVRSAKLFQVHAPCYGTVTVVLSVVFDGPDSEIPALAERVGPVATPPVEARDQRFSLVRDERNEGIIPENAIEVYVRS